MADKNSNALMYGKLIFIMVAVFGLFYLVATMMENGFSKDQSGEEPPPTPVQQAPAEQPAEQEDEEVSYDLEKDLSLIVDEKFAKMKDTNFKKDPTKKIPMGAKVVKKKKRQQAEASEKQDAVTPTKKNPYAGSFVDGNCSLCGNTGTIQCRNCGGVGNVSKKGQSTDCPKCESGWTTCPVCNGLSGSPTAGKVTQGSIINAIKQKFFGTKRNSQTVK